MASVENELAELNSNIAALISVATVPVTYINEMIVDAQGVVDGYVNDGETSVLATATSAISQVNATTTAATTFIDTRAQEVEDTIDDHLIGVTAAVVANAAAIIALSNRLLD